MLKRSDISDIIVNLADDKKRNTVAYASFILLNSIVVKGCRVVSGENGFFLAMPSKPHKDKEGNIKWNDVCYPKSKEARAVLQTAILEEYTKQAEAAGVLT